MGDPAGFETRGFSLRKAARCHPIDRGELSIEFDRQGLTEILIILGVKMAAPEQGPQFVTRDRVKCQCKISQKSVEFGARYAN